MKMISKSKKRRALFVLIAAIMAVTVQATPVATHFGVQNQAYGGTMVQSNLDGYPVAVQGEKGVDVTVTIKNTDNVSDLTFKSAVLELSPSDNVTVSAGNTGTVTLEKGEEMTLSFSVSVEKSASTGSRSMTLKLVGDSGALVHENKSLGPFEIYEKISDPNKGKGNYVAGIDMSQSIKPEGGFSSGQENSFLLDIKNIGNTVVRNAVLTLTLPDGLTVYNASNSVNLGYLSPGNTRKATFPISVDDNAASKNYAITAKITGLNESNESVNIEQVFYVPVAGSGASVDNLTITDIGIPDQVDGQDPFLLSFDVQNQSKINMKNIKITVDVPEGLLNQTKSTFIVPAIPAGDSKNYSVKLFADDAAKDKAYTIPITLSSSTADDKTADKITEYASVYVNGVAGVKTPQLMVDDYSYGGTFVQAGHEFVLDLGLLNTSTRTISNIKVTVSSEDGTIIPVNSSNSFYIDKLGKKDRVDQALMFSVKPGAEQKTTPLTVDMSYEDGAGNAFTSKDVISIPVMQETRLEVDDVIAPPELYAGMQSGVSVQFYNMGKTTLNNLRVTAEGDFDTPESTSYFVGNMESGKSDTYDFGFIPRKGGTMEGKIIFTYEDAAGDQQVLERPFAFEIQAEMPAMDEMPPEDAAAKGGVGKAAWIALGVLAGLVVIGIIVWRKIRKKKLHREMEIDE